MRFITYGSRLRRRGAEDPNADNAGAWRCCGWPQAAEGRGFRLVTLTNSPPVYVPSPLQNAGIDGWCEKSFSVDHVRRFKPAPEVYRMVAEDLNASPSQICMVAAHVWDTIGAQSIGCSGALIARPGNAPLQVKEVPQPQIIAPDLPAMAEQAIQLWQ